MVVGDVLDAVDFLADGGIDQHFAVLVAVAGPWFLVGFADAREAVVRLNRILVGIHQVGVRTAPLEFGESGLVNAGIAVGAAHEQHGVIPPLLDQGQLRRVRIIVHEFRLLHQA